MIGAQQQSQVTTSSIPRGLPEMDEVQFRKWVELLEARTGMLLPPERKSFLVTSLGLRMREVGCECFDEYFARLTEGSHAVMEWATLVDRLTVHETRFFRHPQAMELVTKEVMAKQAKDGCVSIQAWSAGCSTGEEAYTLAMIIDQALSRREGNGYYGVTATDISQPSLRTAGAGIYPRSRVKDLPPHLASTYLVADGNDRVSVVPALKRRVCFVRSNILDAGEEPFGLMDIICCQNLLIYFERSRRPAIAAGLAAHLRPGGVLILGSGELVGWQHPQMEKLTSAHTLAYRRVG